jgi:hypothetical protein
MVCILLKWFDILMIKDIFIFRCFYGHNCCFGSLLFDIGFPHAIGSIYSFCIFNHFGKTDSWTSGKKSVAG